MNNPANQILDNDEIERYARHIVLPEIGGAGQHRLKRARVLVVGAGGLGSPVLQYLAAAGVGTLAIVDDDQVALSNLQRQIIHGTGSVGMDKTDSAAESIGRLNPHVAVIPHTCRITGKNAAGLIASYDIVADGSDNYETRFMLADCCAKLEKPLVSGAVGRFDGTLTVLTPYAKCGDGTFLPSLRDLYAEPPPETMVPGCAEAGIVGALTGVIGTLQAMEIIKLITGIGDPLVGRLLLYDALGARFEIVHYGPKPKPGEG